MDFELITTLVGSGESETLEFKELITTLVGSGESETLEFKATTGGGRRPGRCALS